MATATGTGYGQDQPLECQPGHVSGAIFLLRTDTLGSRSVKQVVGDALEVIQRLIENVVRPAPP